MYELSSGYRQGIVRINEVRKKYEKKYENNIKNMITLLSIYQQVARQRRRKYKIFFKNIWIYKKKVLSLHSQT